MENDYPNKTWHNLKADNSISILLMISSRRFNFDSSEIHFSIAFVLKGNSQKDLEPVLLELFDSFPPDESEGAFRLF